MTDTTAMADRLADPGPPPLPPQLPRGSDRFFSWVSGLGIVRADGWLGGVCAGIAARLRIDPVIVRGVAVVAALFGMPMLVVYAIAWALLPDTTGRIHLREAFHRRFDPALVGIVILFAVGLIPVTPFLAPFLPFGYLLPAVDVWSPMGAVGTVLAIVLVGGLVFVIARSSRRAASPRGDSAHDPRTASADPAAPGTAAGAPLDSGDGASADSPPSGDAAPTEPAMPANASEAEIAQWRETHDAWRVQSDAWRRQQQDAERAAREQARREREAAGAAFAAEADERRRIRRATKPRTSFVFVVAALGAAAVAGAVATIAALGSPDAAAAAAAIGFLTAAIVAAITMVIAGLARRRSGFLTFVAIVLVCTGVLTALAAGGVRAGSAWFATSTAPQDVTQVFGETTVAVSPLGDGAARAGDITIRKGVGDTYISVYPGTTLELRALLAAGDVTWTRWDMSSGAFIASGIIYPRDDADGAAVASWRMHNPAPDAPGTTRQQITLGQAGEGSVRVEIYEP